MFILGCIGVCNTTRVPFAFTALIRIIHCSERKSFFFNPVLIVYYTVLVEDIKKKKLLALNSEKT